MVNFILVNFINQTQHTQFCLLLFKSNSTRSFFRRGEQLVGCAPVPALQSQGQQMTHSEAFSLPGCKLKLSFPPVGRGLWGWKEVARGLVCVFSGRSEGMQKAGRSSRAHAPTDDGNLSLY